MGGVARFELRSLKVLLCWSWFGLCFSRARHCCAGGCTRLRRRLSFSCQTGKLPFLSCS